MPAEPKVPNTPEISNPDQTESSTFVTPDLEELASLYVPDDDRGGASNHIAYTVKLPADQLAALQSIWLELKRLYGKHSPDKSGMIQQAVSEWLKRWDSPERKQLLKELLEIREDTRRRQYKK